MPEKVIRHKNLLIATIFTCVFMGAHSLSMSVFSISLPEIIEHFDITFQQASYLNIARDISATATMVLLMVVADRVDKRILLTATAFLYGIALLLTGVVSSFVIMVLLRAAIGMFGGFVNSVTTAYTSDLYGENRARYISILHTLFALGSMLGPVFAAFCISVSSWQLSYLIAGGVFLASSTVFLLVMKVVGAPKPKVLPADRKSRVKIPYIEIAKNRNVQFLCLGNLLLASVNFFSMWLPTYLDFFDSSTYTIELTTIIMTASSLGMLVSRISYAAFVSIRIRPSDYLRFACVISAALFVIMLLAKSPVVWVIGIALYGFVSGSTFTANTVLACREFPQFSATVTSFTGFFTTAGSMIFNTVVGIFADMGYYTEAMFIPVVSLGISFMVYTFGYKYEKVSEIK